MEEKGTAMLVDIFDRLTEVRDGILAAEASFEHIEQEIVRDAFVERQRGPCRDYRIVAMRWILARLEKDVGRIQCDLKGLLEEEKRRHAAETSHEREAAA